MTNNTSVPNEQIKRLHAFLSCSGSERWLICSGAAHFGSFYPDTSGRAANEGTLAHTLRELLILRKLGQINEMPYKRQLKKIKENELYSKSMFEYMDQSSARIVANYSKALLKDPNALLLVEIEIQLDEYIKEGFGHVDVAIISDHILIVDDLKFGQGVKVYAEDNSQQMLYALGIVLKYGMWFGFDRVDIIIDQCRLDHLDSWTTTRGSLLSWANHKVKPAADKAWKSVDGPYTAGEHCMFCPGKNDCKTRADYQMEFYNRMILDTEFMPEEHCNTLTDAEITELLKRRPDFVSWINGIEREALRRALAGKRYPGMKLVGGRASRKYSHEFDVLFALTEGGFTVSEITETDVLPITRLEKVIGKNDLNKYLSPYIYKSAGTPTLVDEKDERKELNPNDAARDAFEGIELDEDTEYD